MFTSSQSIKEAFFRSKFYFDSQTKSISKLVTSCQASREIWYDPRDRCLFFFFEGACTKRGTQSRFPSKWNIGISDDPRARRQLAHIETNPLSCSTIALPSTKNLNHFQPLYRSFLRALTTPGFLRSHTLAGQAPPTETV